MKFSYDTARPGVRSLADAFSGNTRQKAEDTEMKSLADVDFLHARMGKEKAEADALSQRTDYLNNPETFLSQQTGAPSPLAKKFLEYINSGNFGTRPADPATGAAEVPITEAPPDISPLMEKFKQAYQTYGATRSASSANPENIANALGLYKGQDATSEVQDLVRGGRINYASALNQGSKIGNAIKLYENLGDTGAAYSPGSGNVVVGNKDLLKAAMQKSSTANNRAQLPVGALKLQQDELDAIGISSTLDADIGELVNQLEEGRIKLGPFENVKSTSKNFLGVSDDTSRNFATLQATLEKMRNDSLRLNNGVQTEGDSVRAWNEIFKNMNDEKLVNQRLREIQKINNRAVSLRAMKIDEIRKNYGLDQIDIDGIKNQPPALGHNNGQSVLDEADAILRGGQ